MEETATLRFQDTTATKKIFQLRKRIRAVAGGTSASKTISILVWLIDYAQTNKGKILSVVSESYPHLSLGAMRDFQGIMIDRGYWNEDRWNEGKHVYVFETGTILEFLSVDSYGKAHGPRRDVLFLNECNHLDFNIVDQLIIRTREIVWMDWNPTNEFWFYTEMQGQRDDIDFITLTYKDNEALDRVTVAEIESHKNRKGWWKVYGLGQLGEVEGKIYTKWKVIDEIPHEAQLERYGIDFGYTNDPAAIIALYYYNGGYIIDEVAYGKGLKNKQIYDIIANREEEAIAVADSAEPKSIDEIKDYGGLTIIGAEKRKGETKSETYIKWSIEQVQNQKITVTRRSANIIKEYRNYLWKVDKNGKILNEPEHKYSHSMDAIRYAICSMVKRDGGGARVSKPAWSGYNKK